VTEPTISTSEPLVDAERAELDHLRAHVAQLERELFQQAQRANAAVAAAQERAYWLDRWHVDLNALMARSWAARLRAAMRAVRRPVRALRMAKRRLFG
jgi:hypothetical protein